MFVEIGSQCQKQVGSPSGDELEPQRNIQDVDMDLMESCGHRDWMGGPRECGVGGRTAWSWLNTVGIFEGK